MQFVTLSDTRPFEPQPGVRMRALSGEQAMLNLIELEPGASVPLHSHPHEQLGFIVSGELILTVAGEEHRLRPNDAYQLPGGVEHAGVAGGEGCVVLDVFHPVREDYRALAAAAQSSPA